MRGCFLPVVIWLLKSFFGNVHELLALLCGGTEVKQSISDPSESIVTPFVYHFENMTSCLRNGEHLRCQQPLDMQNEIIDHDWRISILSIMPC